MRSPRENPVTPLDKTLKRAITIKGVEYVVTLSPEAVKISRKGHRLGAELEWADLISGDSALAVALHASIGKFEKTGAAGKRPTVRKAAPTRRKRR
jgi:hypothetical protein